MNGNMTREEAIRRVEICRNFLADNYSDMGEPNFMALNMAIKALEQEPILDKIRAEIEQLPRYGAKFPNRYLTVHVDIYEVLSIIDKYREEADCRECKAEYDCYDCQKYTE